jgi:hypothetical protein
MSSCMVAVMAALTNSLALVGVLGIILTAPSSLALPYQHSSRHHSKQIVPRKLMPPSIWPFRFKFPAPRQDLIDVNNPPRFGLWRPRFLSVA